MKGFRSLLICQCLGERDAAGSSAYLNALSGARGFHAKMSIEVVDVANVDFGRYVGELDPENHSVGWIVLST